MKTFWKGFDKRASAVSAASGVAAGSAAAGGIYTAIKRGLDHPHEAGAIPKALAGLVRKAEGVHPALAPLATAGLSGGGGLIAGKLVSKGVSALQNRMQPKSGRFQQFVRDIGGKIRRHVEDWKKRNAAK